MINICEDEYSAQMSKHNQKLKEIVGAINGMSSELSRQSLDSGIRINQFVDIIDKDIDASKDCLTALIKERKNNNTRCTLLKQKIFTLKKEILQLDGDSNLLKSKIGREKTILDLNSNQITEGILKKLFSNYKLQYVKDITSLFFLLLNNGMPISDLQIADKISNNSRMLLVEIENYTVEALKFREIINELQTKYQTIRRNASNKLKECPYLQQVIEYIDSIFKEAENIILHFDCKQKQEDSLAQLHECEAEYKELVDQDYEESIHKCIEYKILKLNEIKESLLQFARDPCLPLPKYDVQIDWKKLEPTENLYEEPPLSSSSADIQIETNEMLRGGDKCCFLM